MAATEKPPDFVSLSRVVAETGVSRGTLLRWCKEPGRPIRTQQDSATSARKYCLADCIKRAQIDEEEDALTSPIEDDGRGLDEPRILTSQLFGHFARALQAANLHVEHLLEPGRQLNAALGEENVRLRERIAELEQRLVDQIALKEQMVSDEHARHLAEQKEQREQARLDQLMQTLMQFAPAALMGVASKFGMAPMQETILTDAVMKLTDQQFAALAASGMLPPEALAVLDTARKNHQSNGSNANQQTQTRPH